MDQLIERYNTDPSKRKIKDKRPIWILLGGVAIIAKILTSTNPYEMEILYSNTVFVYIRMFFDNTVGRLGFPVLYLIIPFLLFKILNVYWKGIKLKGGCIIRLLNFCYSTFASAMWLIFWFTLLWGLNYNRISTEERLNLSPITLSQNDLFEEMDKRVDELIVLRSAAKESGRAFDENDIPDDIENMMRTEVMEAMSLLNYEPKGKVRVRSLKPKGILLRFGTSGFYFPYSGECNIDSGLYPLQKPFTIAHEMAHGYGVGSESTCNFIAYMACMRSDNAFIQYAGKLAFWRYLASSYKSNNWESYEKYRAGLEKNLVYDLDAINKNNALYPDIMPQLRENAYDTYLKTQGEEDGIASYGKVVELVLSFESQQPDHPILIHKTVNN